MSFRLRLIPRTPDADAVVGRLQGAVPDEVGRRIKRDLGPALRRRLIEHVYSGDKFLLRQAGPSLSAGGRPLETALSAVLFETDLTEAAGVVDVRAASVTALSDIFAGRPDVYEAFARIHAPRALEDVLEAAGLDAAIPGLDYEIVLTQEVRAGFTPAAPAEEARGANLFAAAAAVIALVGAPVLATVALTRGGFEEPAPDAPAPSRVAALQAAPEPEAERPDAPNAGDSVPQPISTAAPTVVRGPPVRAAPGETRPEAPSSNRPEARNE